MPFWRGELNKINVYGCSGECGKVFVPEGVASRLNTPAQWMLKQALRDIAERQLGADAVIRERGGWENRRTCPECRVKSQ